MDELVALILVLLWIPQALRQTLVWLYWLQVKEYRFDRFGVLFETRGGFKRLDLHFILLKFLFLLGAFFLTEFLWALIALLLVLDVRVVWELTKHTLRRPKLTLRAKEIFATSMLFIAATALGALYFDVLRTLVAGEAAILASFFLGILWTSPLVWITKRREIARARQVLSKVKPQVIGVTGSYGKTTTKEFLTQLLSQKYRTAQTTGSENTEFGIARKIIKHVVPGTEVFVVEMGAYRRGEIRKLAKIVSPEVAVVTGIELQHYSLFGGLENIKRAKYELVESLPKGGVVVFNYSNLHCREMAGWARNAGYNVYGYSLLKNEEMASDMQGRVISGSPEGITFEVKEDSGRKKLVAPVSGVHFVENLVGVILTSRLLGLSWEDIGRALREIKQPEKTMQVLKKRDTILIDDSFNSSPKGFEAALRYLEFFETKKIVVTPGIIELGAESARIHRELGRIMKGIDLVILTNADFAKFIEEGVGKKEKVVVARSTEELKKALARVKGQRAILLEGRIPESFRKVLV